MANNNANTSGQQPSSNNAMAEQRRHTERMLARFGMERAVGQGTFGTVTLANDREMGDRVAIKKVMQDPRFKNRELTIMRLVNHPNVVQLRAHYYTNGEERPEEVFLNVVMEFVPETLYRCIRDYARGREFVPMLLVKCFMFQLLRSVAYLQLPSVNVCHRDIKPHNLLVDQAKGILKICDFGSAKQLVNTEPNVAYICSRYYRAPELIFGNQYYTTSIDTWSIGCIFGEMLIGEPLFRGDNSMNQLIEIIRICGTPSREEMEQLNRGRQHEMRLPQIARRGWERVFREHVPVEAHDLITRLLKYVPRDRITMWDAMIHPFFDELHSQGLKLPSGNPLPDLFQWSQAEYAAMGPVHQAKLAPRGPTRQ